VSEPVRVVVRVTTRAGVDAVDGADEAGRLRVRVRAAPAAGAANAAVLRTVAAALGVAPSRVRLVSGAGARDKLIEVSGVSRAAIALRWPALALGGNRAETGDWRARPHPR
jgi:uncharacterized protein YggU (UPF0235/DUF167 family)